MRLTNGLFALFLFLLGCSASEGVSIGNSEISPTENKPPLPLPTPPPPATLVITNISVQNREVFAYSTDFSASLGNVRLKSTGSISIQSLTLTSQGNLPTTQAVRPIFLQLGKGKVAKTAFLDQLPASGEVKISLATPFQLIDSETDIHLGCSIVGGVAQDVQLFITDLEAYDAQTGLPIEAVSDSGNAFPLPLTKFSVTSGSVKQTLAFGPTGNLITAGVAHQTLLCTNFMAYGETVVLDNMETDLEASDGLTMGDLSNLMLEDENNQEIIKITMFPSRVTVHRRLEPGMLGQACLVGDIAVGAHGTMRPSFRGVHAQGLLSGKEQLPIIFSAPPLQIDNPALTIQ